MRIKRAIAVLLTTAMIMTSQSLTTVVMAAETIDTAAATQEVLTKESSIAEDEVSAAESEVISKEEQNGVSEEATSQQQASKSDETVLDETVTEDNSSVDSLDSVDETQVSTAGEAEPDKNSDETSIDVLVDEDNIELCAAGDYFETEANKCNTDSEGRILLTKKAGGSSISGTVTIPSCVQVIPKSDELFYGNTQITKVVFEENSSLTTIADNAFEDSSIDSIELPKNVTAIGKAAFKNSKLANLSFSSPDKITTINESSFEGTYISTISLNKVTEVKDSAFKDCVSLYSVNMNALVTIGPSAFSGCTSLASGMKFSDNTETIGNNAFKNCGFTTLDLSKLKKLNSTENNKGLGTGVFANNTKLVSAAFPVTESFTVIPNSTFLNCSLLKTIPTSRYTQRICGNAFKGCTSLEEIDLADNIRYIESCAYEGCTKLKSITINYKDIDEQFEELSHVEIAYDAFPKKTNVVMYGYDSAVQEYAEYIGYTFKSLYPERTISVKQTLSQIVISKKARPGEEVTFTVTSVSGATLQDVKYYYSGGSFSQPVFLGAKSTNSFNFSFVMPDKDITVESTAVSNSQLLKETLTYEFDGDVGTVPSKEGTNSYSWETRGQFAKLSMFFGGVPYGNWAFNFVSSNPNVISVNSEGVISAIEKGSAAITVSSKFSLAKSVKINVTVSPGGDDIQIGKMYTGQDKLDDAKALIDAGKRGVISIDPVTGYPVVTFDMATLAVGAQKVSINCKAFAWSNLDDHSEGVNENSSYMVKTTWTSADTRIASVDSKTSNTNKNTVTVLKNSSGETQINISTLNFGETKPNERNDKGDTEDNIAHVIIKVIDVTPRLGDAKITLNNQLSNGAEISIVPVYGYDISDDDDITVCTKSVVGGVTSYTPSPDFNAVKKKTGDNYSWYITTSPSLSGSLGLTNKRINYINNLYLCGKFKDDGNLVKRSFQIPVPSLTVTNEQLRPYITQTGAINLFYNRNASEAEKGTVIVSESLKTNKVERYELVSATNYKGDLARIKEGAFSADQFLNDTYETDDNYKNKMTKGGNPVRYDSLSYNFDIKSNPDSSPYNYQALITRCSSFDDIAKKNNLNVVSGYLYIFFEGYKYPVMLPITVRNVNTAPNYKLSMTSVTAHEDEKGQDYMLFLYPSTMTNDKKNAVNLANTFEEKGGKTNWYIGFNDVKTTTNFMLGNGDADSGLRDKDLLVSNGADDPSYIRLKVRDTQYISKGVCSISVHMTTWSDPDRCLFYNFSVNTTGAITAKLNSTSKIINAAYVGGTDKQEIVVSPSSGDAYLTGFGNALDTPDANAGYKEENLAKSKNKSDILTYTSQLRNADSYKILYENTHFEYYDNDDDGKKESVRISITQPGTQDEADKLLAGSYIFKLNSQASLKNNNVKFGIEDLKTVQYIVTVTKAQPIITLGGFTLNIISGVTDEAVSVPCRISNLIAGTTQVGNDKQAPYTIKYQDATYASNTKSFSQAEFSARVANITYDAPSTTATAKKGDGIKNYKGTYSVSGVTVVSPGGATAAARKFYVTVGTKQIAPSITLVRKGTINMVVPSSAVAYTATIRNVSGNITDVAIAEVSPSSGRPYENCRYKVTRDPLIPNQFKITVNDEYMKISDAEDKKLVSPYEILDRGEDEWTVDGHYGMKPLTPYFFKLYFNVSSMEYGSKGEGKIDTSKIADKEYDVASALLSISPQQVFPTLTKSMVKDYAFAGQDRTKEQCYIKLLAQVPQAYRGYADAEKTEPLIKAIGFEWASGTKQEIKDEFAFVDNTFKYDPVTGIASIDIKLQNASAQIQNKSYILPVVVTYEHQAKNTYSQRLNYTVNVKK